MREVDRWFGGGKLIVVHSIVASCTGININYWFFRRPRGICLESSRWEDQVWGPVGEIPVIPTLGPLNRSLMMCALATVVTVSRSILFYRAEKSCSFKPCPVNFQVSRTLISNRL